MSDEFFSTFLNDAAFVKTFLISERRALGRTGEWGEGETVQLGKVVRENVRGIADLSISTAATTSYPLTLLRPSLCSHPLLPLRNGMRSEGLGMKKARCAEVTRISGGDLRSLISLFAFFFSHLRRGDYHPAS